MDAQEALAHGIVSRVVPAETLDDVVFEMAEKIAKAPAVTVKLARMVIQQLGEAQLRSSLRDEMIYQTFNNKSDDYAEFRAARADEREPRYTGS
jgi:enoyl-CoA hydratase